MDIETVNKLKAFRKKYRFHVDAAKQALKLANIRTENSWMPGWNSESHGSANTLEAVYNALDPSILDVETIDRSMISNRNVANAMNCLARYSKDLELSCRQIAKKPDDAISDEDRQMLVGFGALKEIVLNWSKEYTLLANAITMELDARLRAVEMQRAQAEAAKLVAEERRFRALVEQSWPPVKVQNGIASRASVSEMQDARNNGSYETAVA